VEDGAGDAAVDVLEGVAGVEPVEQADRLSTAVWQNRENVSNLCT
jgi:hypothetical protein